jgi:hypothetical protein
MALFLDLQNNVKGEETRYRVVGIRRDGKSDVRASNLFRATAEALQAAMLASGQYKRVIVEEQQRERGR